MKLRSFLACVLAALLPALAAAQDARTINAVALRAGPDRGYPFVASYGPGTPIAVQGCTEGYGWCDVIGPNGYRGWVYAGDIGYMYQRREVPVVSYGPVIGIPIVAFALGSYWGSHYAYRSWYRDRDRWMHYRPPVYRPPAYRPPPHRPPAYRPPPHRPPPVAHRPPPRPPAGGPPPGAGRPPPPSPGAGRPPPPPSPGTGRPPPPPATTLPAPPPRSGTS